MARGYHFFQRRSCTSAAARSFLACFFFLGTLLTPGITHAAASNLSGWAWSSTIGWVSFSRTNLAPSPNYGVSVDSSGNLSGYAWSSNIGWISFNASDVNGCPSGTCAPTLDTVTGNVTGWARAIAGQDSQSGGWDGWIHLAGPRYKVLASLPNGSGQCTWSGYAWGGGRSASDDDAVVGWLNFSPVSGGVVGTGNACGAAAGTPDLLAAVPQQAVTVNVRQTFTATVTNSGGAPAGAPFPTLFQISSNPTPSAADITDIGSTTLTDLDAGAASDVSLKYTFTTPGPYYMRACADKSNANDAKGVIVESNETNNCSTPWTQLTSGTQPDLKALFGPQTVTLNQRQNFTATVDNIGGDSTGDPFPTLFQIAPNSNPSNTSVVDVGVSTTTASIDGPNGTVDVSIKYTFTDSGPYYMRACADKGDKTDKNGQIVETDELNNCSDWQPVTIATKPDLAADFTPPPSVTPNSQQTYTATAKEVGGAPTLVAFPVLFQVKANGDPNDMTGLLDMGTTTAPALAANGSEVVKFKYTLPGPGPYYIRACADKNDMNDATGVIGESDELHNCSDWQPINLNLPDLTCTPANSSINPGDTANFSAAPVLAITYTWTPSETGVGKSNTGPSFSRKYATAGSYSVTVSSPGYTPSVCNVGVGCTNPLITSFTAAKTRVKQGTTTTLSLVASGINTSCIITNNQSDTVTSIPAKACSLSSADTVTDPITTQTVYTANCDNGLATASVVINVLPFVKEF